MVYLEILDLTEIDRSLLILLCYRLILLKTSA